MARKTARILIAGGLVLLVTLLFHIVPANATTIGFAYLITILLIAASWGLSAAIAASVTATLSLNFFFLPPIGTMTINDPQNWIAMFAFLVCSLVASQLSDRAQRRTAEAITRQREMQQLYALSRAVMLINPNERIEPQIAEEIARIYESPFAALYDRSANDVHFAGRRIPHLEQLLRETASSGTVTRDIGEGALIASISLGGQSIGSLAIHEGAVSTTALNALLNLVAITLENARSRALAMLSEAARQSEEFKSTLLDGLAHEFKTPLTSIKAASTALLGSVISAPEQREELLTIVEQEANRLSRLVTETIQLARIEAGKIQLHIEPCSASKLLQGAVEQMESVANGRLIQIMVDGNVGQILADPNLIQLAIRQLLDNALKYSQPRSPILVRARAKGDHVEISVQNNGDLLSDSERQRVFEKFYRGESVRNRIAGSGMGLAIARQILIAHRGNIHAETNRSGNEFILELPAISSGVPA